MRLGQMFLILFVTAWTFSVRSRLCRISPTPNSPIATATKSSPSKSETSPNVNRVVPVIGSWPIVASRSPSAAMLRLFSAEPVPRYVTRRIPSTVSATYSGGPKETASDASGGASSVSPTTARIPPMNEPIAAIPSAGPARPCLAIS
ncbi:hypothetical protein GCM10009608_22810 [Pseudonocardia alaniniphila]